MLPTILVLTTFAGSIATSLSNVLLRNVKLSIVVMCPATIIEYGAS